MKLVEAQHEQNKGAFPKQRRSIMTIIRDTWRIEMIRTISLMLMLAVFAVSTACSSSAGGSASDAHSLAEQLQTQSGIREDATTEEPVGSADVLLEEQESKSDDLSVGQEPGESEERIVDGQVVLFEDEDYIYLKPGEGEQWPPAEGREVTYEEFIGGPTFYDNTYMRMAKTIEMSNLSGSSGRVKLREGDVFLGFVVAGMEQKQVLVEGRWLVWRAKVTLVGGDTTVRGSVGYRMPIDGPDYPSMTVYQDYADSVPVLLLGDGDVFDSAFHLRPSSDVPSTSALVFADTGGEYTVIENVEAEVTNFTFEFRRFSEAYMWGETSSLRVVEG